MSHFHQKPHTFVGELSINVMNLARSLTFYQDIIGFNILQKTERKVVLTSDSKTPLVTLVQPIEVTEKEMRTTGLYHFALLLPSRADLSRFLHHLLKKQYKFAASDHAVSEALYLSDPDGNGIEIYRDRPTSEWSWSGNDVKMVTEPLDYKSLLAESELSWGKLPSKSLIGHIHLHVKDLDEAENYYTDGLGFSLVSRYPGALFISTGKYHHHLGLNIWNGTNAPAPTENSVGLNWFSLVCADEETRKEKVKQLQQIGATVVKEKEDYLTVDPSGNHIYLTI